MPFFLHTSKVPVNMRTCQVWKRRVGGHRYLRANLWQAPARHEADGMALALALTSSNVTSRSPPTVPHRVHSYRRPFSRAALQPAVEVAEPPPPPLDTNQHFTYQPFVVSEPFDNACRSAVKLPEHISAQKEIIDLRSIRGLCQEGPSGYADLIRSFTPAPTDTYADCAVVGSGGILLGSSKGREIDGREAVFRINRAPTNREVQHGEAADSIEQAPISVQSPSLDYSVDVGKRTTWRVTHMDEFTYTPQYPRNWLRTHSSMAGTPRTPLYAISCNKPFDGRCRPERLEQVFGRNGSAANHLISPALVRSVARNFVGVKQKSPTTGMVAITLARKLCRRVHVYGFSDGTCPGACYHYFDRMPCKFHEGHVFNHSASLHASNGYHDFMSQVSQLERLHLQGDITWHRGSACAVESEGHERRQNP